MSYTYAILEVSQAAYDEIRQKLEQAGYQHAFHRESDGEVVDMHGIALRITDRVPNQGAPNEGTRP